MQEMGELKRFPEFLPREDMQNWRYLYAPGVLNSLAVYFSKTLPELRCAKFRLRPPCPHAAAREYLSCLS
jgi:hypothetical protein